jgi:hypothetical protein
LLEVEIQKWRPIINAANIKGELIRATGIPYFPFSGSRARAGAIAFARAHGVGALQYGRAPDVADGS